MQYKVASKKTFQKDGRWVERPAPIGIVACACGGKYIQTRPEQVQCLLCSRSAGRTNPR